MEGQEGTQQPHLVLAHKLFLLRHPDVQDIEKVRLKDEVLASIKADGNNILRIHCHSDLFMTNWAWLSWIYHVFPRADMISLYETLVEESVLERDQGILDSMRANIDQELKKLDEKWVSGVSPFPYCLL